MKYLNPGPFSGAASNGRMSDLEYDIAVGNVLQCEDCGEYVEPELLKNHGCLKQRPQ